MVLCVKRGEPSRRDNIPAALHQSGLYARVARQKPRLRKRHMAAHLEFANKALTSGERKFSDEPKIELFGTNPRCHVWRKPVRDYHLTNTISKVKNGGGSSSVLLRCFSAKRTGRRVRIEANMNEQCPEISWMKTCSRVLRTSDWGETAQRQMCQTCGIIFKKT